MNHQKKEAALDQARFDLALSIKNLESAAQNSVGNIQEKIQPIKQAMNLKNHFSNHFWKTSLACLGLGLMIARRGSTPLPLNSKQIRFIAKELQKNIKTSSAHPTQSVSSSMNKVIASSDLLLPIGIALAKGLYEKIQDYRKQDETSTPYDDATHAQISAANKVNSMTH